MIINLVHNEVYIMKIILFRFYFFFLNDQSNLHHSKFFYTVNVIIKNCSKNIKKYHLHNHFQKLSQYCRPKFFNTIIISRLARKLNILSSITMRKKSFEDLRRLRGVLQQGVFLYFEVSCPLFKLFRTSSI